VAWLDGLLPSGIAELVAPTWFTCVGVAGLVTLFVMLAVARRNRLEASVVAGMVLWCYVAAVAAGIVVPMMLDAAEQAVMSGHVHLRWAGMTSFWGYLAGLGAVAAVCRAHRLSLARLGDLAAAPLGGALFFARLGCFVAGCDYGKVTSLPWAVRFPAGSPAWHDHVNAGLVPASRTESLPVHPTELYEAVLGLVIIGVALALARRAWARRGEGRVFLAAAALYAIGRIGVEACRGDAGRGIYAGLSSGQIFSLSVLAVIGVGVLVQRVRVQRSRLATALAAAAVLAFVAPSAAHAQGPVQGPQLPPTSPAGSPATPAPGGRATGAPGSAGSAPGGRATGAPGPAGSAPGGRADGAPGPAGSAPGGRADGSPASADDVYGPGPVLGPQLPSPPPPVIAPGPAVAAPPATPLAARPSTTFLHFGALLGTAVPINRRADQVATLAGGTLTGGLTFGHFGAWLDLQSFANRDASHGTLLLSASFMTEVATNVQIGGRFGAGATLVNFKDPVFRDAGGSTLRFEGVIEYELSPVWSLWARPLSFDILSATALGGPIVTWQLQLGVAYRFAVGGHRTALPPPPPSGAPPGAPPPPPPPPVMPSRGGFGFAPAAPSHPDNSALTSSRSP
jgi:phosphatidylglycerol:prolipoprotein diacylglycerol transferase